jgi:hypothetical protein
MEKFPLIHRKFLALQANTRIADDARNLITRYLLYAVDHNIPSLPYFPRKSPRHVARFLSAIVNDFRNTMQSPRTRKQILSFFNAFCAHPSNPVESPDKYRRPLKMRSHLYAAMRYVPGITRTTRHKTTEFFAFTDRPALLKHLLDFNEHHPDALLVIPHTTPTQE